MTTREGFVIIDEQRCFMPVSEGLRLNLPGFGELAVANGELTIPLINSLTKAFQARSLPIAYTGDKHHLPTAHISETPNYIDTWPAHGVEGTPGSDMHPDLYVAQDKSLGVPFYKGQQPVSIPAEDTSYTAALARNPKSNELLPDWLHENQVGMVYIGGLALGNGTDRKLCVDSSAVDLLNLGFDVTLVTDAVEAVQAENRQKCFTALAQLGIRQLSTNQVLAELNSSKSSS